MGTDTSRITEHLRRFRQGDTKGVFFDLLEMGNETIPVLIAEYRKESDPHVRDFLVEVIWQYRDLSVIPFLGEALHDQATSVWQQALDGLVALASPAALDVLRTERERHFPPQIDSEEFCHWLDEAIEQTADRLKLETK